MVAPTLNFLSLLSLAAVSSLNYVSAAQTVYGGYNIIPRRISSGSSTLLMDGRSSSRHLQNGVADLSAPSLSPTPTLISFDGNLTAIKNLALAKARQNHSSSPQQTFSCDSQQAVHVEIIHWKYSIETVPQAVVSTVYGEVQEITLDQVAPLTLSCLNPKASFANISTMDVAITGAQESLGKESVV